MKDKISPSMMCVDPFDLEETLKLFRTHGIDYLHIDVMDGIFVPNYTLGTDYCRMLKKHTQIPLDIHLMITEPEHKLSWFPIGAGDFVSIHYESTHNLQRVLAAIRAMGAKPMVALNPATPICVLEDILEDVDAVLLMTVNPGFAGQKLIPAMIKKVEKLRQFLDEHGAVHIEIEVDGNVSFENARAMKAAGANIFVAGTSGIFNPALTLSEGIERFKNCLCIEN